MRAPNAGSYGHGCACIKPDGFKAARIVSARAARAVYAHDRRA
ncbi:hypothetical protein [Viridibacterium curvum]